MRHRSLRVVVISLVTRDARGDGDVVVVVDMAIGASPRRNHMGIGQRPSGLRVIELAIRPEGRVMALFAGRREAGVRHRSLRVVVISLVARDAGRDGNVVVVVDVAVGAYPWRVHVRSLQWPAGLRVIELAVRPDARVVALLAGGRETRVRHRALGIVVIGLVTRNARGVGDVVVVVNVAVGAYPWRIHVRSRQRPAGLRVIELAVRPSGCVVALLAGGRETRVRHRALGIVVIGLVARNARGVGDVVVVVNVAVGAYPWRIHVQPRQREAGLRVIELAIGPGGGVMALFAGGREPSVRHGALGVVVIGLVARNARSVGDVVVVVDVTVRACSRRNHV